MLKATLGANMTKNPVRSLVGPNPNPHVDDSEERQVAIAQLRGMSREDRLALLMRNFTVDCAEVSGRARRGAAAPRKAPLKTPLKAPASRRD